MKQSRMTVSQLFSKDEQQDGSWHFIICKQCADYQQCFATHTGSKGGLYKLPTATALQFTKWTSINVFSQTLDNASAENYEIIIIHLTVNCFSRGIKMIKMVIRKNDPSQIMRKRCRSTFNWVKSRKTSCIHLRK